MRWKQVQKDAEEYLKNNKFSGITKFASLFDCSRNTMRKAIDASDTLKDAEQQYKDQSGTPTAVTLTDKVLTSRQSVDVIDPSIAADTDNLLQKLIDQAPPEKKVETKAQIEKMTPEQKQKLAVEYAKQIDDNQQDDPKKRKPRRRKV